MMTEMAFANERGIYKIDFETNVVNELYSMNAYEIAIGPNGEFFFVGDSFELRKIKGNDYNNIFLFRSPCPDRPWISNVKLRPIDSKGNYRIYLSYASGAGGDGSIYYLNASNEPVLYYKVDLSKIPAYNNCCQEWNWEYWGGNFAFDDQNNLYLSNGNCVSFKVSIYKVSGATLDGVSGEPVRIYTESSNHSIEGMQFVSPDTLYFCGSFGDENDKSRIGMLRLGSQNTAETYIHIYS